MGVAETSRAKDFYVQLCVTELEVREEAVSLLCVQAT